jgi:hypothetical protein
MRVYNVGLRRRQAALTDLLATLTRDAFHRRLPLGWPDSTVRRRQEPLFDRCRMGHV